MNQFKSGLLAIAFVFVVSLAISFIAAINQNGILQNTLNQLQNP